MFKKKILAFVISTSLVLSSVVPGFAATQEVVEDPCEVSVTSTDLTNSPDIFYNIVFRDLLNQLPKTCKSVKEMVWYYSQHRDIPGDKNHWLAFTRPSKHSLQVYGLKISKGKNHSITLSTVNVTVRGARGL
jgi:hypothetical protein